jgi:hypothetical protein
MLCQNIVKKKKYFEGCRMKALMWKQHPQIMDAVAAPSIQQGQRPAGTI